MVSTRKKRQSNKRLLSQLDDFDQDMIIGNAASERQENVVVNEGTNDQDFTVGTSNVSSIVDENALNVKTLERCFNERNDREMNNIVETVEERLKNAILTAIDNIVAPKIELAIRSINTSSGRDVTSVSANSERREHAGINAFFENASENNNKLNTTNENDETRQNNQDEVSELSVPGTHFDRQPHTHHRKISENILRVRIRFAIIFITFLTCLAKVLKPIRFYIKQFRKLESFVELPKSEAIFNSVFPFFGENFA